MGAGTDGTHRNGLLSSQRVDRTGKMITFIDHIEAAGPRSRYMLPNFRAGNTIVSVQASSHHYCNPRVDGLPLTQYTEFEVAAYLYPREDKLPTGWATPHNTPALAPFKEYWVKDNVASYVPAEIVQQIVYALCDAGERESD